MTEKEYIEREALLKNMEHKTQAILNRPELIHKYAMVRAYLAMRNNVINAPAADVVEVVHGEWLPDYETFVDEWERESEPIQTGWACSLCGRKEFAKEPYCHCGAKMDGKDGEGK